MTAWLDRAWSWLGARWRVLFRRRTHRIQANDRGIFDPYVPLTSVKQLSQSYAPELEVNTFEPAEQPELMSSEQSPEKRGLVGFRLVVILLVTVLAIRLIDLQIVQGRENYSLAEGNRLKTELVPALRGLIYDRNGAPLVKNIPNFSVVLDLAEVPTKKADRAAYINQLSGVLSLDHNELTADIDKSRNLSQITLLDNLNRDRALALQLELNNHNLAGLSLVAVPVREYSADVPDLGHLLGYIGRTSAEDLKERPNLLPTSYVGKAGLEEQYDTTLQGVPGINTIEVDSRGRALRVVGSQPSTSGQSLILGLDSPLQQVASTALGASITANHATSGAAVVMDVNTGDVLAMVSAPSFDNNLFSDATKSHDRQAALSDPLSPLLNRAIAGQYPSGSTVKPTIAAAALQEGVVTAGTRFDTSQPITAGAQTFHDWKVHGMSDIKLAIAQSNDIFFYTIGGGHGSIGGLGVDRLDSYLRKFGFGQKTGIDLPGEKAGNVPTPAWKQKVQHDRWYLGDTYNLSIGQGGFLITPLQLADDIAAIANGGNLLQPKMVRSVVDNDGQSRDVAPVVNQANLVDPANIATVREGMHEAVQAGGTAHSILGQLPVDMAAKTGTAQTSASLSNTHAWFTAFAPFDQPQIAVAVVVEGGGEGFDVAGPVVRQIMEQYFHLPLTPIAPAAPTQ